MNNPQRITSSLATSPGDPQLTIAHPAAVVIGLGNPILGDDAVGWRVAEIVEARLAAQQIDSRLDEPVIDVFCMATGGLDLMEQMAGYDRACLIDAIYSGVNPAGQVNCLTLGELPDLSAGHFNSPHDASLQIALQVGRLMGVQLPETVMVVAVEAQYVCDFSEQISLQVEAAIPEAVEAVFAFLAGSI